MAINIEKMKSYLLSEYPDQEDEILNGIKVLQGFDWDEDEEDWIGEKRSDEEIEEFVQEMDNELDEWIWDTLDELKNYEEFFNEAASEMFPNIKPEKLNAKQHQKVAGAVYERMDDNQTDQHRRNVTEAIANDRHLPIIMVSYLCENALPYDYRLGDEPLTTGTAKK